MDKICMAAGAAGRHKGQGYVYVMEDENQKRVKIGCSRDPERRAIQIGATLIDYIEADEMNGAETAAQHAVENELKMEKVERCATDWYKLPKGVTSRDVLMVVKRAVKKHNKPK
ncbi:hypothetical protein ACJMK2_011918 [Sinanodonta woodiana]|uniref:Bacteriophage T5 Orf172 DNA-binding domain-containing protein n=1 Tax=Sinanodonta woodiana TaxID=1069815 RepID=A0ABD3V6I2_SINWO